MKSSGNFYEGYFRVHMIAMFLFGICFIPLKNKYLQCLYNVYSVLFVGIVVYFYSVLESCAAIDLRDDIGKFTLSISYFITHLLGALKTSLVLLRRKRMVDLMLRLEGEVFAPDQNRGGPVELKLVNDAVNYSVNQCYGFWGMVVSLLSCRVMFAVIQGEVPFEVYNKHSNTTNVVYKRETPYPFWSGFIDISGTPLYELASAYQILAYMTQGIHIGGVDAIICGCMRHMKSQFLIIKETLERILNDPDVNVEGRYDLEAVRGLSQKKETEIYNKVVDCVKHHQEVLKYCDQIEEEFKYLMLVQFLTSLLVICFGLFQLSVTVMTSFAFASIAQYIMLMTGQIFLYCYVGHMVWEASDDLSTYVFHCQWFITGRHTKQAILMLMMRCQRPILFTAGKFTFLILQTFVTILRASFSYFMVLRRTNDIEADR